MEIRGHRFNRIQHITAMEMRQEMDISFREFLVKRSKW